MKLTEMKLMKGKTEQITIMDFRSRPGDILTQVQMGKIFRITKQGKVVAMLSPPEPNAL
jgi:antitoxin (DNA-binding transcriptional repressor) of toxin-antitoxin stability system